MKINTIRPLESNFTEVLIPLALNVEMLYYYGRLPDGEGQMGGFGGVTGVSSGAGVDSGVGVDSDKKRPPTVAIVGARKNTSYGYEVAYAAAYAAAKAGAVVVSGLAYGIDSVAHRAALDAGGITVAVLGTPISQIYPVAHRELSEEIVDKGGAVISEYGPDDVGGGMREFKARFLARNRLISGLSDVVLVVEAADRSGTLNTATHALNQGRDLMVVPGDITRENSRGCNKLLAQGAIPYTEPNDLLEVLFGLGSVSRDTACCDGGGARCGSAVASQFRYTNGTIVKRTGAKKHTKRRTERLKKLLLLAETETEKKIISAIFSGKVDGDEIIEETGILASEFSQAVTILEIKGVVKALGANRWMLK